MKDIHTFTGKRKLGATDISDFTDFQGIGHDPLYRRYASVGNLIDKVIDPKYAHFLAIPDYDAENGEIKWYVDQWTETPARLPDLPSDQRAYYETVKNETLGHYKEKLNELSGEDLRIMACALRYINDDFIYCADGKVYAVAWGMAPDNARHIPLGELIHSTPASSGSVAPAASQGSFSGASASEAPAPTVAYTPVTPPEEPRAVAAQPEPFGAPKATIRFNPGTGGTLDGASVVKKPIGSTVDEYDIPGVVPFKDYKFRKWDPKALGTEVTGDMTFTALYRKKCKWWKWLLWLLIAALIALGILALCGVFNNCSCSGKNMENGVLPPAEKMTEQGDTIDDNGTAKPIELKDGELPDREMVTAPVMGEGGEQPPISREPGLPAVISDRLILFLEDENGSVDALADAFKQAYPGDEYSIIGFDRYVKSLVIQVPSEQREKMRNELPGKIPGQRFIVFDESIYELNDADYSLTAASAPGWHLDAVGAPAGWEITKGSPSVKVAVVDDGIDRSHKMFQNRIVNPYNVFTQDNRLSRGTGHGTMIAGLAVGSLEYRSRGAAGIAPDCMLIPVQVADNDIIPLSAIVSGIMYAVHQGADVVNVSIGPQLPGLEVLPIQDQVEIARTQFLNVAKLWDRVCDVANRKNSILVFAAGNDHIISSIPPENRSQSSIVVGAVDSKLRPTEFSNYGYNTDISAPGEDIYSSYPVNSFDTMDGTSFAAPIVTGTVALMKSLYKDLTVTQARDVLYRTGKEVYGFMPPMVQIAAALQAVKNKDFSRGPDRGYRDVPGGKGGDGSTGGKVQPIDSWNIPQPGSQPGTVTIGGTLIIIDETTGSITIPGGIGNPAAPGTGSGTPGAPGNPAEGAGGNPVSPGNPGVPPASGTPAAPGAGDDEYGLIREKIRRLKQEIRELESQLPENQRNV